MSYDVFICEYEDQRPFVPRHYTTGYSVCERIGSLREDFIIKHLRVGGGNALAEELVVTDVSIISAILEELKTSLPREEKRIEALSYTYMILRKKM